MATHRLFVPSPSPWPTPPAGVIVRGDEARHALRVKRLRQGERVELISGDGLIARGVLAEITLSKRDDALRIDITEVYQQPTPRVRLEVWSSVPKGGEAGEMIDMLSQLGCDTWRPLTCERSVAGATENKVERMRRVCVEAAKQCGRAQLMKIGEPITLVEAITSLRERRSDTRGLVCDAGGDSIQHLQLNDPAISRIVALVGPEGGFSVPEFASIRDAGLATVRLGRRVLRIETASVAAAAIIGAMDVGTPEPSHQPD
ncbi:MAG: 16S rRNA (uracil(1498)-N(3))-methyltransferase, partial [Phycisphaerales bacterium]|nr:16S rRNA (uracil(1498)-N(3))-methyltransferase [Phycisphaerales bacterium]